MHLDMDALMAGLPTIRQSPADTGVVRMVLARPEGDARKVLEEGTLDVEEGLVGDNWRARGSKRTEDGSAEPDAQITLMNARAIAHIAGPEANWPPAGDQFFVDLDLGVENLPIGSTLKLGHAVVQVTPKPHRGCAKFVQRFGADAMRWVNSTEGRAHNLRGIYVRVLEGGVVRTGDAIVVLERAAAD